MQFSNVVQQLKSFEWKKHEARARELFHQKPVAVGGAVLGCLLLLNLIGIGTDKKSQIMERPHDVSFQNGRILNDRESTFYHGKEKLLAQKAQTLIESQKQLEQRLKDLEEKIKAQPQPAPSTASISNGQGPQGSDRPTIGGETPIQLYPPGSEPDGGLAPAQASGRARVTSHTRTRIGGPDLIAFPVKGDSKTEGLVLPSGSYVKAKVLTGVDVPEGKTYPVLMVLDFSYVAPNDHKIDLSGCFMIAKAEGDLSTERVQMQATKMSCVSKRGKMFEREVNGFIADDRDGSFAMKGKVNSKQGRVASMAFLASVIEGVGKAVQAAQTTQSVNPLGGSQSVLTGDTGKYVVAGGASNAAGMVAQWYLQQAQSLAPTVEVGSGRDVWIVIKDKVSLPEEFFRKERKDGDAGIYSYVSRIVD